MGSNEPRWHAEAADEAHQARDWYARRSAYAARGFLLSLEKAVETIAAHPDRYPETKYGGRKFVFPNRYPFTVVYRLLPDSGLEIVAVASQWRRPDYWLGR